MWLRLGLTGHFRSSAVQVEVSRKRPFTGVSTPASTFLRATAGRLGGGWRRGRLRRRGCCTHRNHGKCPDRYHPENDRFAALSNPRLKPGAGMNSCVSSDGLVGAQIQFG